MSLLYLIQRANKQNATRIELGVALGILGALHDYKVLKGMGKPLAFIIRYLRLTKLACFQQIRLGACGTRAIRWLDAFAPRGIDLVIKKLTKEA